MNPTIIIPVTGFIVGAVFGSWAACTGYRLPRKMSLWNRSRCMSCGHRLSFLDLVPIWGYFFCRGHCRYCGLKISASYLLPEINLAFLSMLLFVKIGPATEYLMYMVLLTGLAITSVSDTEMFTIPDVVLKYLAICALPFIFWTGDIALWSSISGAVLGFAAMVLPGLISNKIPEGGDIKLVTVTGIYLGPYLTALAFAIGTITCCILICLRMKKFNLKDAGEIPLAPYLFVGVSLMLIINTWM